MAVKCARVGYGAQFRRQIDLTAVPRHSLRPLIRRVGRKVGGQRPGATWPDHQRHPQRRGAVARQPRCKVDVITDRKLGQLEAKRLHFIQNRQRVVAPPLGK